MSAKRPRPQPPTPKSKPKRRPSPPTYRVPDGTSPSRDGPPAVPSASTAYLYAHQVVTSEILWLWQGFIPKALPTLLYGPSLAGKSTVATAVAAAVTRGRSPTGPQEAAPATVIWLSGEEPIEQLVKPRLEAAGADLRRVCFPQLLLTGARRGWKITENPEEFIRLISTEKAAFVVLDPIACFLGGEHPPESNLAARLIFAILTQAGAETGVASLIFKHPRKSGRGGSQEQLSGGLEWFNTPRSVLLCGLHPTKDDNRVLVQQKPSLCEGSHGIEFVIEDCAGYGVARFLKESGVAAGDVLAEELDNVSRAMLQEAKDFLREYLREGERRTTDLQKWALECGLSWITVRRAKGELDVVSEWRSDDGTKYRVWCKPEKGWG